MVNIVHKDGPICIEQPLHFFVRLEEDIIEWGKLNSNSKTLNRIGNQFLEMAKKIENENQNVAL